MGFIWRRPMVRSPPRARLSPRKTGAPHFRSKSWKGQYMSQSAYKRGAACLARLSTTLFLRYLLVTLFVTTAPSCHHRIPQAPSSRYTPLDPVDEYIFRYGIFAGSLELTSPIGYLGNPIRPESTAWLVVPQISPPDESYTPDDNKYLERTRCLGRALESLLEPHSPTYDNVFEASYRTANETVVARLPTSATLAQLREEAFREFYSAGLLNRWATRADALCPRAPTVPPMMREWTRDSSDMPGITGQQSFSWSNDPCSVFKYCMTNEGPALMVDLGTHDKQECYDIHQTLLTDTSYKSMFNAAMKPHLNGVSHVPPSQAKAFLSTLYDDLGRQPFYLRLLDTYKTSKKSSD